ncbi:MAG: hypothetical protein ABSH51_02590 [Solirubrobacteraceae bacterium]|jgi:pimeloyl-ACP methyl ester carboxylesterase
MGGRVSTDCPASRWLRRPDLSGSGDGRRDLPTFHLIGDKDFISIDQAVETLGLIPNSELAILPNATHVDVTRRPHQVLAMLTPFLDAPP